MSSDIYRFEPADRSVLGRHNIYAGLTVDVAESSLGRVTAILAGISGGVYKAVGSALKRAADAGKTGAKKAVTSEYAITQSQFLSNTRNINHFVREADGSISVVFGFGGYVIPLTKFNTRIDTGGRIVTQVKRSNVAETLDHAFEAQMGPHKGVYERIGVDRFPLIELYGPATTQMMYSNENVLDAVEERMADTYEKRIEHEIDRVLAGIGV